VTRQQRRARFLIVLLALLAWLAPAGVALAQGGPPPSADSYQCANGSGATGDCTGTAWVRGVLNSANSFYREGDFVPISTVLRGLITDRTYTLRIQYYALDRGLHAYDYFGSVDGSQRPGQQIVPCGAPATAGTEGTYACGHAPFTLTVPPDTNTSFPSGSRQEHGEFSIWGATP
jgi:hypothetical protein